MTVTFSVNAPISAAQFIDVLTRSTLGLRRPVDDRECIEGMLNNANLIVCAWAGDLLVGVARSLTDFHYACYVSDLAVDKAFQHQGIGKQLLHLSQQQLGPRCKLILLAAPDANAYYQKLGFEHNPRAWVLDQANAHKLRPKSATDN